MSLLENAMTACVIMDKRTVPDGYGGYVAQWSDGAEFQAAIVYNSGVEALQAQAMGVTSLYTVTTTKAMNLQYHDVFKRMSDNKIFRVTSDGDDNLTPPTASLNMRQVSAEEWKLNG